MDEENAALAVTYRCVAIAGSEPIQNGCDFRIGDFEVIEIKYSSLKAHAPPLGSIVASCGVLKKAFTGRSPRHHALVT